MNHTPGTDRGRATRLAVALCLAVCVVAIPALAFGLPVTTCNPSATYNNVAASISISATTGADPTTYAYTKYWFDAAAPTTITAYPTTATVSISTLGAHTISFFSVDASGGVEATQTRSFTIADTLKPRTSSDVLVVYLNSATINLTPTDAVPGAVVFSGVAKTYYKLDSAAVATGTVIAATGYGNHTLQFWSVDNAGNSEATLTASFFIDDTIKPTTVSDASASYMNSAVITLTPADSVGGTGVAHTYYILDGGAQTEGKTITVNTYGNHTLKFWSVDGAGNEEAQKTASFFVDDSIAPVTTSDAVEDYVSSAVIHLSATDVNGSGVAHTNYNLDGAGFVSGTTISVNTLGAHTLQFYSIDNEGNAETPKSVSFEVNAPGGGDTTAPTTTSNAQATYPTSPATIHLVATENTGGSGIESISYKVDGGATVVVTPSAAIKAATTPALGIPATHSPAAPTTCACHSTIIPAGHSGGAAPSTCACHGINKPTAPVEMPASHEGRTGNCVGCHPAAGVIMPSTSTNPNHYGQTAGYPGSGACEACHTFHAAEETTTPGPVMSLATDVVVSGNGAHTLEFWSSDEAGNIEAHHVVNFTITPAVVPVATSITIRTNATSVARGKTFILSGVVAPASLVGTNVQVMVKYPTKSFYSYSSLRTCYMNGAVPSWWYRYAPLKSQPAGVYKFYAFVPASANFLYSQSPTLNVTFK